ncbi:phosphate-binding protein PstS 1 precursor [Oxobacter pfennigii]|uniref:Phosphate-binding protein n=1 Tax=Oxobacter pfennigii TaxID=36849 RepID=A0A0P8WN99_9CLOT|nr:phosphate ABC transporter substrate-binding protein [Oxobacter pfennigii]KPU44021.1 phosphate-binding protein PstS 1 precursor [Oxobacter pfennigii]
MIKKSMRKLFTFILASAMTLSLAACNSSGSNNQPSPTTAPTTAPTAAELEGTIQIAGSTSVQPLSEELAKVFMGKNAKVKINVAGGGSGAGIKAATEGTADIGASSRELKSEEKVVKEFVIAMDGIAIVVHKDNKVSDLKKEDIMKIFSGEITDWSELGGDAGKIQVVIREEGSGTRGAFEELVMGEAKAISTATVQNSTGAVRTAVSQDKNAIGYISLGSLNSDVKAVKVDGVEATEANVKANTYKISRPFVYMTQKDPSGATKAFIDFIMSAEGQAIVQESGFITVK